MSGEAKKMEKFLLELLKRGQLKVTELWKIL